jgi:hypothetical protein
VGCRKQLPGRRGLQLSIGREEPADRAPLTLPEDGGRTVEIDWAGARVRDIVEASSGKTWNVRAEAERSQPHHQGGKNAGS